MAAYRKFFQFGNSVNSLSLRYHFQGYVQIKRYKSKSVLHSSMPPKPKRPAPLFARFINQVRNELLEKEGIPPYTNLIKTASERWKAIDTARKASILEEYRKEQQTYVEEMKKYTESLTPMQQALLSTEKNIRQLNKIFKHGKRNIVPHGFILFFAEYAKDLDTLVNILNDQKLRRKSIQAWHDLSEDEKQKYIRISENFWTSVCVFVENGDSFGEEGIK